MNQSTKFLGQKSFTSNRPRNDL